MRGWYWGARMRFASGRFLFLAIVLTGCQTIGGRGRSTALGDGPPPVIVRAGPITRADQAEAARLMAAAEASFEVRRFLEVLRATADLVDRLPESRVSGEALRLSARAEFEVGAMARADEAAGRYLALLAPGDPRGAAMRLLQAAALDGDPVRQLDRVLRIESGATDAEIREAAGVLRAAVDALTLDELQRVVDGVESSGPMKALADASLSASLLERSRRVTTFAIGAVLPYSGPPALAEFSVRVAEGIEVAAATVLGEEFTVTVVSRDDEGDPKLTAQLVSELEAEGVAGIVGFLQDDILLAAAQAREHLIPLVSPTARSASRAGEAVYSLEGPDLAAAASVARYAASRAFQRVAMVYPQTPEATAEADMFAEVAEALGIRVVGRFPYEAGAMFFESQILAARDSLRLAEVTELALAEDDTLHMEVLEPVALFLPIPPEDVEFLAPQIVHFALDTLAIEILGTSGWTDPQTLQVIDARHTTGVVATAPVGGEAGSEAFRRFQRAYEEYFQRSLVGSTSSVGYDATLLLLEALRPGRIRPDDVKMAFESLFGVEGATGVFSVVDASVVRLTEVVRIANRVLIPVEVN